MPQPPTMSHNQIRVHNYHAEIAGAPLGELTHRLQTLAVQLQARAQMGQRITKYDAMKLSLLTDAINRRTMSKFTPAS